jgi:hypothetical protein
MLKKNLTYTITLLVSLFTLLGCKKDEFTNLTSTLSGETAKLGVTEGESVIANVLLSEELSEDLTISLSVETDGIANFINDNDYNPIFEYSSDLGETWKMAINQEVVFDKRSKNLKIRIQTTEDDRLEFHEEFDLTFTANPKPNMVIMGSVNPVRIEVSDNEPNKNGNFAFGALYDVDENYNFKLVSLNRKSLYDASHKSMIDNGLDPLFISDVTELTQSGDVPITRLDVLYESSGLGGSVINLSRTGGDGWRMALNLFHAYNQIGIMGIKPMNYNEDKSFGTIMVHEYGHIMTLNRLKEINNQVSPMECTELAILEGCLNEEAVLNQFNSLFYEGDEEFNDPQFVSDYAQSNIAEDIAETFACQVAQDIISPINAVSSGALRKIHFVADHPHTKGLRDKIRELGIKIGVENYGNGTSIRALNITNDGKRIPCTDMKAIYDAHSNQEFKSY